MKDISHLVLGANLLMYSPKYDKKTIQFVTVNENENNTNQKQAKVILILVNGDATLYNLRKELLSDLIHQGHFVHIIVPCSLYAEKLTSLGCNLIDVKMNRRGINPLQDLFLLRTYYHLVKTIHPTIVLCYTIKPNVYGGLVCQFLRIPYIANITGLGVSIEKNGILKIIALNLYRLGLRKAKCVFFQNEYNKRLLQNQRVYNGKSRMIPGSGVNLEHYKYETYPAEDDGIRVLFISRIFKEKGIDEFLTASLNLKEKYPKLEIHVAGNLEENYDYHITELASKGIVNYHGWVEDSHELIAHCHCTVLPSYYYEGMANVLLESAATGRPVITTRVPGCAEAFDEGLSGFGSNERDPEDLEGVLERFIKLPWEQKCTMGLAGRQKMEKEFDRQIVVADYNEIINDVNTVTKKKKASQSLRIKRAFDLITSTIMLAVLFPILIVVSLLIKIDSNGSVIFKQYRIGYRGKRFIVYKFRTMSTQAPKSVGTRFLKDSSHYITRVGRWLRKTSIDELPQLINVLKGDMSLIGPRPLVPEEEDVHKKRNELGVYEVRPGITGWAQINGRDTVNEGKKAELDAYYVQKQSLRFDLNIILKSIVTVFKGSGIEEGNYFSNENDSDSNSLEENRKFAKKIS